MSERRDVDEIGILGMNDDAADLLRVGESDARPRLPAIDRFEHPLALRDIGAHVRLARSDVDHLRIRRRDRNRPDRTDRLRVEDGMPRAAGIHGLPHSAIHAAEVEVLRLTRDSADGEHASGAERSDEAPVKILKE
jgi:hypothetical protein